MSVEGLGRERRCEHGPAARNTLSCLTPDTTLTLVKLQIALLASDLLCTTESLRFACLHKALWPVPGEEMCRVLLLVGCVQQGW